ncbi:alpha/beta fold hydrolase [Streptomyces beijiangensis]|uniref:Dienelactone hydrolase family protein n=1 Tax=Streptomyces beijiangensis TaxID=163361 RepID=A0A939F8H1_9ACTN|nr:alpha/beta fold hydrolase [Streptomyces beijiangensis]MBO0512370.1 dienelactone hydrolase family protein [Streptomyces beijiangensis]
MTVFVLVSGPFTGGWIWEETAERLRQSGAQVHPLTLTGLGERRHLARPDTDLETHIEDVVQLIDHLDGPELVLVGHDYAIHPVLGAADRRPERINRIVHLDAGLPQDGDAALALVPDQEVRERLMRPDGPAEHNWRIPAPRPDEWQRWGSTDGLSTEALARLDSYAAPQPSGTLIQPLRLNGALAALPTTGVFCTAGGVTIAMVETLVRSGPPQFRALADPRVTFFELHTGHWPMLSSPEELATVLLRAAADEGHRIAASDDEQPFYEKPFVLDVADWPRERIGSLDLHLPDLPDADGPQPAIVFVHGGPVTADLRPTPRDWPIYSGHARYAVSRGVVGVTVDHGLHALTDYAQAAEDISAAVELVRADPRVDADRIALWFFSAGGLLTTDWLAAPPPWLRCVAANYPVLAPLPGWSAIDARFRPVGAVRTAGELPIVLSRAGLEHAAIAATVEEFLSAAKAADARVEIIDVPAGHHGFDVLDHTEESRHAVAAAYDAVLGHLQG